MLLYTRLAPPKVPKRRSRAGCTYCKEKKKKCDETRPACSRCSERGLDCAYEPVRPRQRRKRESSASGTTASGFLARIKTEFGSRRYSDGSDDSNDSQTSPTTRAWLPESDCPPISDEVLYDGDEMTPLESTFDTRSLTSYPAEMTALSPMGSVACGELMSSFSHEPNEDGAAMDNCNNTTSNKAPIVARRNTHLGIIPSVQTSRSRYPDLAMISPIPVMSPLLEFQAPAFSEFSDRANRRALVDHFCNVLSHLIVFREETGNPFQQLVLPLTRRSMPVMNAIYALASAHLEYRGVDIGGEKSMHFHSLAINGLTQLIQHNDKTRRDELLAAIMLLVYYEVLVQEARSNIVGGHLRGALSIMKGNPDPSDPTSIFLGRAFRFYDVIAALSFGTAPLSEAPAAGCLQPFPPLGAPAASNLSNVDTLLGMATTLWPIIHRLSNLLSVKTELEGAARNSAASSKAAVLRTEFETTCKAIEVALEQWHPCLPPHFTPDDFDSDDQDVISPKNEATSGSTPTTTSNPLDPEARAAIAENRRLNSILSNSLAYRHSAFVYLYRTIYGHARSEPVVQRHTHISLRHCVSTVAHEGPMGALLWPLFVAACEATTERDRCLARRAFAAIDKRQGMTNIERAWEIVREVWSRADRMEEDKRREEEARRQAEMAAEKAGLGDCLLGSGAGVGPGTAMVGLGRCFEPFPGRLDMVGWDARAGSEGRGVELWRRVSEEMGVNIVFG